MSFGICVFATTILVMENAESQEEQEKDERMKHVLREERERKS